MALNPNVNWELVIQILERRFPRELDIAMLTAHAAGLEQALAAAEGGDDGGHEDDGVDSGDDSD